MNSFSMKAFALALLGGSLQVAGQLLPCGESSNADFQYEVSPSNGFTLFWSIDADAETVSFQVVSQASAWAAIGFPESDLDMIGADAIVGLPGNDSVIEYDLTAKSVEGVVVFDVQDITETSVTQDAGTTTIAFTRPLAPGGGKATISATPGDTTAFIYAVGVDNDLAYHGADGSDGFRVDVFCGSGADDIVVRTPSPVTGGDLTDAPSVEATVAGSTTAPVAVATTAPDGDRGIDVEGSPAPTPAADSSTTPVVTPDSTPGPSTSEEVDGQGDTDGAVRVSGGCWAAAAVATGVAAVLAGVSL